MGEGSQTATAIFTATLAVFMLANSAFAAKLSVTSSIGPASPINGQRNCQWTFTNISTVSDPNPNVTTLAISLLNEHSFAWAGIYSHPHTLPWLGRVLVTPNRPDVPELSTEVVYEFLTPLARGEAFVLAAPVYNGVSEYPRFSFHNSTFSTGFLTGIDTAGADAIIVGTFTFPDAGVAFPSSENPVAYPEIQYPASGVPEPTSIVLLGLGAIGLMLRPNRKGR